MGVYKRASSKYWYIQFQFNQKTYVRSSKTTEKAAAKQMEREWRRVLHAQSELGISERIKFGEALCNYVTSKAGTPSHKNIKYRANRLSVRFGPSKYLDELTFADLEILQREQIDGGNGSHTINHLFAIIRGTRKYVAKHGYLVPALEFPPVAIPKKPVRYLSRDEEAALLKELEPTRPMKGMSPDPSCQNRIRQELQDNYDLVVLLLDTGARYSEVAKLQWSQIDLANRILRLWRPKVSNESVLYLTDRAHNILKRRNNPSGEPGPVFLNRNNGTRSYAPIAIRKAFRRAGLPDCSIHTLRHTHASRLIQNGMSVYEVREILGHADIKTTMRYAHLERQVVSARARDVINQTNSDQ